MEKKRKIALFIVLFVSVIFIPLSSPSSEEEIVDISEARGLDNVMTGEGVVIEETTNEGAFSVAPSGERGTVTIDEFVYVMTPTAQGLAYINFDPNGTITQANYNSGADGTPRFRNTIAPVLENSRVYVPEHDEDIEIYLPEGSQLPGIPSSADGRPRDYDTIYYMNDVDISVIPSSDNEIAVNKGALGFSGDGEIFVPESVTIENVVINSGDERTGIVLDGGQGGDESVSFNFDENSIVFSTDEDGNSQIILEEKNFVVQIDEADWFSLLGRDDSQVIIENRDEQGLIPKVTSRGDISIQNGDNLIYSDGGRVNILDSLSDRGVDTSEATTSPAEIVMLDKEGKSLLNKDGDSDDQKVFVDNFGRVSVVDRNDARITINRDRPDITTPEESEEIVEKIEEEHSNSQNDTYSNQTLAIGDVQLVARTDISRTYEEDGYEEEIDDLIIALSREGSREFVVSVVKDHMLLDMKVFRTEREAREYFESLRSDFNI